MVRLRGGRWRGQLRAESLESREMFAVGGNDPTWASPVACMATATGEVATTSFTAVASAENIVHVQAAASATQHWQQSDRVSWWNPQDTYRFSLTTAKHLQLDVSGQSVPVQVALFDSGGHTIVNGLALDQSGALWSGDLAAGTYTVTVTARSWLSTGYTLSLDVGAIGNTSPPSTPITKPPTTSPPTTNVPSTNVPSTNPPTTTPPVTNPQVFPDVAYFGGVQDWNLNAINAPESWSQGYRGQGTVVAVVDTGIDWTHVDLKDAIWTNAKEIPGDGIDNDHNGYVDDVHGWDFVNSDSNPMDENGHGTHVAGTIAAARNDVGVTGIAYQAHVMPVRVLGADGAGSDYAVAQGIRYAVDNGADIINLSLGSSGYSSSLYSALSYAASKDVLIVAAAGNESAAAPSYPARFSSQWSNVVSVGAFDRAGAAAYFSNAVGNVGAVQVAAPGVDITSTLPGGRYGSMSGTSMAAPQVAGLAALILSAHPQLTASQLRQLITAGANKGVSGSRSVGSGINAAVSVAQAKLVPVTNASPATTSSQFSPGTALASAAVRTVAEPSPLLFGKRGGLPSVTRTTRNPMSTQAATVAVDWIHATSRNGDWTA